MPRDRTLAEVRDLRIRSLLGQMKQLSLDSSIHNTHTHTFSPMLLGAGSEVKEDILVNKEEGGNSKTYPYGVYTGDLVEGRRHGIGQMQYNTFDYWFPLLYQGKWADDKIQDEGIMKYNDGSEYYGFWEKGKRHGQGKMTYMNGDIYSGCWLDDRRFEGTLTFNNKCHYTGMWKNDKMHHGIYTNTRHSWRFEGTFDDAYPLDGTLTYLDENGEDSTIYSKKWQRKMIYEEQPVAVVEEPTTEKKKPKVTTVTLRQQIIEKCKKAVEYVNDLIDDQDDRWAEYEYRNPQTGLPSIPSRK